MKRTLSLVLLFCMLLSLFSCSSSLTVEESKTGETATEENGKTVTEEPSAEETATEGETEDSTPISYPQGFSVGWARAEINPANGTGLGGYSSADTRLSKTILDDLMLTCTALSDGESAILVFSFDLPYISSTYVKKASEVIEKSYGIPASHVFFNITHTHSGPALLKSTYPGMERYANLYYTTANRLAGEALRDLEEATILVGRGKTDGINHVRRYVSLVDGSYLGKNLKDQDPALVGHETQADEEMQIIKFDRKTKKDVILCNWQCHPTGCGGSKDTRVSADWIGSLRKKVEAQADVLFSYHQGASGNVVAVSGIKGEKSYGGDLFTEHGKVIADTALAIMASSLTEVKGGKIQAKQFTLVAEYKPEITSGQEKKRYGQNVGLSVLSVGDIAFATCMGEPHDTMGMTVKHESPFAMTFFCGYTDGYVSYIPASFAYDNGGYEVDATQYEKGTGERIVAELLKELNTQYAAR